MTMPTSKKRQDKRPRASTPIDKEIGLRIRAMRTDIGMSQEELGTVMKVSFQQVQKYEKGVNRISAARLIQISNALNTTPHHLLGWETTARMADTEFDLSAYKLSKRYLALPENLLAPMKSLIDVLIRDHETRNGG
jgi:transcriptional regulator with XRE-family HTH domain